MTQEVLSRSRSRRAGRRAGGSRIFFENFSGTGTGQFFRLASSLRSATPAMPSRTLAVAAAALISCASGAQVCFPNIGVTSATGELFDLAPSPPKALNGSSCNCASYTGQSCCTDAYAAAAKKGSAAIYTNWTFGQCGKPMSAACAAFFDAQECSFGCDPRLSKMHNDIYSGGPAIPICSKFADAWWSACKNDFTCLNNFIFNPDPVVGYGCRPKSVGAPFQDCKTYQDTWGDAITFMGGTAAQPKVGVWGSTYTYNTSSAWFVHRGASVASVAAAIVSFSRTPPSLLSPQLLPHQRPCLHQHAACGPQGVHERRPRRGAGRRAPLGAPRHRRARNPLE